MVYSLLNPKYDPGTCHCRLAPSRTSWLAALLSPTPLCTGIHMRDPSSFMQRFLAPPKSCANIILVKQNALEETWLSEQLCTCLSLQSTSASVLATDIMTYSSVSNKIERFERVLRKVHLFYGQVHSIRESEFVSSLKSY